VPRRYIPNDPPHKFSLHPSARQENESDRERERERERGGGLLSLRYPSLITLLRSLSAAESSLPFPSFRVRLAFNCISVETLRRGKSAVQGVGPSSRERRSSSSPFPARERSGRGGPPCRGARPYVRISGLRNHPSVHFRFATRRETNGREGRGRGDVG